MRKLSGLLSPTRFSIGKREFMCKKGGNPVVFMYCILCYKGSQKQNLQTLRHLSLLALYASQGKF